MSNKLLESIQVGRELREGTNYNSEYADERFNELINKVAEAVLDSSDIVEVIDDGSSLDYESIEEYIDDPDGQGELNYASILSGSDLEFFNGFIDYWHVDVVEMETGPIKVLWVSHPVGDTFYIPRSSLDKINSGELIEESASNELSVGSVEVGKYLSTGFGPGDSTSRIYYQITEINDKGDCIVDDGLVFDEHGHYEGRHGGRGMVVRKSLIDDGSFVITDSPYASKN